MVVRIRLKLGRRRAGDASLSVRNRQTALALSSLMTPLALMAWALGCWRLAADMKWTGEFAITQGLFSHWQVWIAVGIAIQFGAFLLHKFAHRGEDSDDAAFS